MTSFFDKLNLRPGERRLLVLVGLAGFVVLNVIFVWPRFGELGDQLEARRDALAKAEMFRAEQTKVPALEARLRELEDAGSSVVSTEQAPALLAILPPMIDTFEPLCRAAQGVDLSNVVTATAADGTTVRAFDYSTWIDVPIEEGHDSWLSQRTEETAASRSRRGSR